MLTINHVDPAVLVYDAEQVEPLPGPDGVALERAIDIGLQAAFELAEANKRIAVLETALRAYLDAHGRRRCWGEQGEPLVWLVSDDAHRQARKALDNGR